MNLDYLEIHSDWGEGERIEYSVTPEENGILEITPRERLEQGTYCIIQGDPLGTPFSLPTWCFRVVTGYDNNHPGSKKYSNLSPITTENASSLRQLKTYRDGWFGINLSSDELKSGGEVVWKNDSSALRICSDKIYDYWLMRLEFAQEIDLSNKLCMAISPDMRYIVSYDPKTKNGELWMVIDLMNKNKEPKKRISLMEAAVFSNQNILAYNEGNVIKLVSSDLGKEVLSFENLTIEGEFLDLAFSADGNILAIITSKNVVLLDSKTGEEKQIITADSLNQGSLFNTVAFSPNKDILALHLSNPDQIVLLDMATGRQTKLEMWQHEGAKFSNIAFSADGNFVANSSYFFNGKVDVMVIFCWNVDKGHVVFNPITSPGDLPRQNLYPNVSFSPDGLFLVADDKIYGISSD